MSRGTDFRTFKPLSHPLITKMTESGCENTFTVGWLNRFFKLKIHQNTHKQ